MLQEEDPCLVSNMTESILPLIPERGPATGVTNNNSSKQLGSQGTQVYCIVW